MTNLGKLMTNLGKLMTNLGKPFMCSIKLFWKLPRSNLVLGNIMTAVILLIFGICVPRPNAEILVWRKLL